MEPMQRLMLETAWEAVEEAGYGISKIYGSKTGVFIGRCNTPNEERYENFISELDPLAVTGSFNSILSSRISYIFNLQGPSIVIDTACSSGLVAVHEACLSLKNKDCDLAIAGGVQIRYMPVKSKSVDMIEANSGKLSPFDKDASGTVWGEGVGAIILKPLSKAIADGDNVHAVIKGIAINNDGASNGITAPSAKAQEDLIARVWEKSKINPETISYIETHGTGTKLGDPIEVKGLTNAFRRYTNKKQFCGIGSVKANIGHAVAASGVASLFKVILALKEGVMPPSLNFNEPNPHINFCDSPVYLNDRLKEWQTQNTPRRAGVSSFGFSGTNCHVLIEQAPKAVKEIKKAGLIRLQALALSARSQNSLKLLIDKYIAYLEDEKKSEPEDICFTANTGRSHYKFRIAFVAGDIKEFRKKLLQVAASNFSETGEAGIYCGGFKNIPGTSEKEKSVLENNTVVLGESADKQINELLSGKENAIYEICELYSKGADIEWDKLYKGQKRKRVSLPVTPLEKVSYWPEYHVKETKSIGADKEIQHNLLERCLVKSINEGIYSARLSVNENWELKEHLVGDNNVMPGTSYMEMAVQAAKEYFNKDVASLKSVQFFAPLVVCDGEIRDVQVIIKEEGERNCFAIVSCIDNEDEGGKPEWVTHASGEVVIGKTGESELYNIEELLRDFNGEVKTSGNNDIYEKNNIILKKTGIMSYGPRWQSIKSVRSKGMEKLLCLELPPESAKDTKMYTLHPSLLDVATGAGIDEEATKGYLPFSYGELKIFKGIPHKCYSRITPVYGQGENNEIIKRNIKILDETGDVVLSIKDFTLKKVKDINSLMKVKSKVNMFYKLNWVKEKADYKAGAVKSGISIVLKDQKGISSQIIQELKLAGNRIIEVDIGAGYQKLGEDKYIIDGSEQDYERLFRDAKDKGILRVLHLLTITGKHKTGNIEQPEEEQQRSAYSLFHLTRAMFKSKVRGDIEVILISENVNEITKKEAEINPGSATLFGLGKVISKEYSNIRSRCIDIDTEIPVDRIVKELNAENSPYMVAYRNGERYVEVLERAYISGDDKNESELRDTGVYVVTGGMGGIGLEICKYLASKNKVNLALINRSNFPERSEWDKIINSGEEQKLGEKLEKVIGIEETGAKVICCSADVTNYEQMKTVIGELREKYGRINGVIHSAGIAGDGIIINKAEEVFKKVLAPKVKGTWILDKLTEKDDVDFFIMFSSIASVLGVTGQGDYTAANSYMDSFAAYRNKSGKKGMTINWPGWKETGMAAEHGFNEETVFKIMGTDRRLMPLIKCLAKTSQT